MAACQIMCKSLPMFDTGRLCSQSRSCAHTGEEVGVFLNGEPVFAVALAKQLHDAFAFGEDRACQPFVQIFKSLRPCFGQGAEAAGQDAVQRAACGDVAFKRIVDFHVGPDGRQQIVEGGVVVVGCSDMVEHGDEEWQDVQFVLAENLQREGDFQIMEPVCADVLRQDGRLPFRGKPFWMKL